MQNDLEIKIKAESAFLTPKDKEEAVVFFITTFTKKLYDFPKLGVFLNTQGLFKHEKRIETLEKKMNEMDKIMELEEEKDTNIKDDSEYFIKKYTETLFLHSFLPKEKRIALKDIYI